MTRASPDLIYVFDMVENRNIYTNGRIEAILGYTSDEIRAMGNQLEATLYHPDDIAIMEAHSKEKLAAADDDVLEYRFRMLHKDGSVRWLHARETPFTRNADGSLRQFVGVAHDVTQARAEEERLRLAEYAVENARDAILITDTDTIEEPGPRVIYVNPAFTEMTGYAPAEIIGHSPRILQGAGSDRKVLQHIRRCLTNWQDFQVELLNYRKDGTSFWVEINARPIGDDTGHYTHWIAVQRDITARKAIEAERNRLLIEARQRADCDHLTGLTNRRAFFDQVTALGDPPTVPLAVVLLDIANFKFFNETYGHGAGDRFWCRSLPVCNPV